MKLRFWCHRCSLRCAAKLVTILTAAALVLLNISAYYTYFCESKPSENVSTTRSPNIRIIVMHSSLMPQMRPNNMMYTRRIHQLNPNRTILEALSPVEDQHERETAVKRTVPFPLFSEIIPVTEDPEEFTISFHFQVPNIVPKDPAAFHPKKYSPRDKCRSSYPRNEKLHFNNIMWQVLRSSDWSLYLYGAYYDNRLVNEKGGRACVRVIGIGNRIDIGTAKNTSIWCQLWFEHQSTPKLIKATQFRSLWPKVFGFMKNGILLPIMFSCPFPKTKHQKQTERPFAVSLVRNKCEKAVNKLQVVYNPAINGKKKDFAVCVKGLDFPQKDISIRLVEWIELLQLLGVHKIFFYQFSVHPNTKKVLDYYKQGGQIDISPLTLPGEFPNEPLARSEYLHHNRIRKRQMEIIPYNDCLNRYMYRYKYLVVLDIDEVIVPANVLTWKQLLTKVKSTNPTRGLSPSSFNVKQYGCFFDSVQRDWFPDIPRHMHMLQHIYKTPTKGTSMAGTKSFIDPSRVQIVLNHWPHVCILGPCLMSVIDLKDAQLQHYKHFMRHCGLTKNNTCSSLSCLNYTEDKAIWKYKTKLIKNVGTTMTVLKLKFIEPTVQPFPWA